MSELIQDLESKSAHIKLGIFFFLIGNS